MGRYQDFGSQKKGLGSDKNDLGSSKKGLGSNLISIQILFELLSFLHFTTDWVREKDAIVTHNSAHCESFNILLYCLVVK